MSNKQFAQVAQGDAKRIVRGRAPILVTIAAVAVLMAAAGNRAAAQPPGGRVGEVVPRDVREMYDTGLSFLATTQREDGGWPNSMQEGAGTVGMGLMVFLASGEDPNFGLYSVHVRRALRNIISGQDAETGYLGQSMYHHGFGMLALAEAYGAVDDRNALAVGAKTCARSAPPWNWRCGPQSRRRRTIPKAPGVTRPIPPTPTPP